MSPEIIALLAPVTTLGANRKQQAEGDRQRPLRIRTSRLFSFGMGV